jgi:hypothetical protein
VKNYLAWCSVTVASNPAFTGSAETFCVPDGSTNLSATPLTGFELGATPWHDTDGDHGSGDPGTVSGNTDSTTVTVNAPTTSKCVWVCCETQGTTDCPTTDQCP